MRASTRRWRRLARSGLATGLAQIGFCGRPASIAVSATDKAASGLPKYTWAAAPKP
jgi:hypothetical protein